MSTKAALKAVKASIDAGDFTKAVSQARDILKDDASNLHAFMFLGFAQEKLGKLDEAEEALAQAHTLKPQDVQPCKGLVNLFEKQGSSKVDSYHGIAADLASIYAQNEDREQCQNVVQKYEAFVKKHGDREQYRRALSLQLPSSNLYSTLEGRVPHPSHTYQRLLESAQQEEASWIGSQIAERRTRLGAKLEQVTRDVKHEAISKFEIEQRYQDLIDWTQDDDKRHMLDQELLQRMLDNLLGMPAPEKSYQRDKIISKANGMVIIKQQFALAWNIALEWVDAESLADWDPNILRSYIEFFPEQGLSKILKGFVDGTGSPFPPLPMNTEDKEDPPAKLSEADQLILMNEGLEDCKDSMLAYRIMAHTYLALNEHESCVETARKSQLLHHNAIANYALELQDSIDAVNLMLGQALITYQSPRHHPEARALFDDILKRKPLLTAALLGVGLIYEEDEDYAEAVKFLSKASERDPDNIRINLEYAWCRALNDDLKAGLEDLEGVQSRVDAQDSVDTDMRAEVLYRIAYCKWELDPNPKARRDKNGSYKYLIDALKANSSYAPAYTLLGFYFQDYARNKARARVAFQKAFELSTSELTAAEQLARTFSNTSEWELVELVAQRVIESGKARPAPGSKKKAYSWPYTAMGVVQMNRSQFSLSIPSFQHALRISPEDYHSWVGLGESYHNSGRYVAASRAFNRAESMEHGLPIEQTWFAKYMLANVQREVGNFTEAIDGYENVLKSRPEELGVLVALLQTLSDCAWSCIYKGQFGRGASFAGKALQIAQRVADQDVKGFNLWKSVGDALSALFESRVFTSDEDIARSKTLLNTGVVNNEVEILVRTDGVTGDIWDQSSASSSLRDIFGLAAIMSYKRAVFAASHDAHAQAVAWYNLGHAEQAASAQNQRSGNGKAARNMLKAAIKCFRNAIELEAGNSDFWNALGVATMTVNAKVSQHSFVRSLHLNDNSARAWTNLGVLYLLNNETELANEAFTRAQSADPEYADAWVGQGTLATLFGNLKEARGLYKHAFEIADSNSIPVKRQYSASAFDYVIQNNAASNDASNILQPLFALRQLKKQLPDDMTTAHLLAQFAERVGESETAAENLESASTEAESIYEKTESNDALIKFAQSKADLARQLLAKGDFDGAQEHAQMALDVSEDDIGPSHARSRRKLRISAGITLGLAQNALGYMAESITTLQVTLELTKSGKDTRTDPDMVCLLAQVLWARGGDKERAAARNQLFEAVDEHDDHVGLTSLLAVMMLLDGDEEGLEVAVDDLKAIRTSSKASIADKVRVAEILAGVTLCQNSLDQTGTQATSDAQANIMLSPDQPQGWLELAQVCRDEHASEMALNNALQQIPPKGNLTAENLAQAYSMTGDYDGLRLAIMLAPWTDDK